MTTTEDRERSWERVDHLGYLKNRSIFEDEMREDAEGAALVCASCAHTVTYVSEKVAVLGRHDQAFPYYRQIVRLGCFRNAPGCTGYGGVSRGYSWFRGYEWQIQLCGNCFTQLGWKYTSPDDSFYGLVFGTLREDVT